MHIKRNIHCANLLLLSIAIPLDSVLSRTCAPYPLQNHFWGILGAQVFDRKGYIVLKLTMESADVAGFSEGWDNGGARTG